MSVQSAEIYIDGAARGNPGPAAYAVILQPHNAAVIEESGTIGTATNNVAEYTALIQALERAKLEKLTCLKIYSDSELIVKQMNGLYKVKSAELSELHSRASMLRQEFEQVEIVHIRRESNKRADALCNRALDAEDRQKNSTKSPHPSSPPRNLQAIHERAVSCLNSACAAWQNHSPGAPSAEQIWEQLWNLLEEEGCLNRKIK